MANLSEQFITKQFIAMDADLLPPANDRIFKALLTHPDAKQVLIDIISTVIERKVLDVQIRNNELPVMDMEEKQERFDVNCVTLIVCLTMEIRPMWKCIARNGLR